MPLFRVTSLNSLSILLKIGIGLISSKILAIFVGPAGMALMGNLRNFMTSVETVSTLGFQNGIVKYIANHKTDEVGLKKIISTVFYTLMALAVLLSSVLFAFSGYWNALLFGPNSGYKVIFQVLAFTLPWYIASIFLIAIINGLGKFRTVIYINIVGNIIGLVFSVFMVCHFRTFGALLSIIVPPSLLFFTAFYAINKQIGFFRVVSSGSFDLSVIRNMASYSLMALVSSVCSPLVFLAIRNYVIENVGIEPAGFLEAVNRISSYYLLFVSTILSVYFLPKLAVAPTKKVTRNIFKSYYTVIFPVFIIGLIMVYLLRFVIVNTLFTTAFLPVTSLFFWQLVGDVFKAGSLILGYEFFAKKLTIAFIATEILSLLTMFFLSRYLVGIFQTQGVVMAHAITYFMYWIILAIYFRKELF